MPTIAEVEKLALNLPEDQRAALAAHLLRSLPSVFHNEDEGIEEAVRRDADMDASPSTAISLEQLDQQVEADAALLSSINSRRKSQSVQVTPPTKRITWAVLFAYLVLFALSLPVPLLHHYQTDKVIETMRPIMKLPDGHWAPMLMPAHILLLRWLGQFFSQIPYAVIGLFVLSFWQERFRQYSTLCAIAIFQCAFATLYAFYSTLILGAQWLAWIGHAGSP